MVKPVKSRIRRKSSPGAWSLNALANLRKFLIYSLPYVVSMTVAGLLLGTVAVYAVNSPTFGLQEVRILNSGALNPAQAFKFCELRPGENLILLDLVNVQQVIKRKYPEFKEVLVRRVLPGRIDVLLK